MSLITKICETIASRLEMRLVCRRDGQPYLERYYLLHSDDFTWLPGVYLHKFLASDEDPELHNHPWKTSLSVILSGGYTEEQRIGEEGNYEVEFNTFRPGYLNLVRKNDFHRIELDHSPTWTLFFSGDRQQDWGFWNQKTGEYLPWRDHIQKKAEEFLTKRAA